MGFSVSSATLILALALLGAGGASITTMWALAGDVEESQRASLEREQAKAWTEISVSGTPSYNQGVDRYTLVLSNDGATVLEVDAMVYLLDGVWSNDKITSDSVEGDATTNLWLPGETLTVVFQPVDPEPSYVWAVTQNGASAWYRR